MKSKFLIKIKKLIAGKYFSTFQSIFKWSGLEITDVRKYSSGDPFRYINRKQTAKHNELYTSLFQQEKDISLDVFFDINYNWKWQTNLEKVNEFFADMMIYCKQNGIRVRIFYPSHEWFFAQTQLKEIVVDKHRERAYQWSEDLHRLVVWTTKKYQTALPQFFDLAKKNTKKRAMIIFSDFLDVSEDQRHLLKYFDKEHTLGLIQIPVSLSEGQNYSYFLLDQEKELDSKKLQTICL